MRQFLIFLLIVANSIGHTAPFTCDDTLYIALNEPGKTGSVLNVVNDTVYPFTYDPIGPAQTLHNGMGFHPTDGLIYGMLRSTQVTQATVFSADDTGLISIEGTVPGLPNFDFFSGDIGPAPDYNLFLHYIGVVYEVDTDTQTLVATHSLNNNLVSFDIAYDQTTNLFYGVERQGNGRFFAIDIGAGTLTEIGPTGTETFGSMMADSNGRIFGNSNGTNGFFEFDKTTGERRLISETVGGAGDGAYCQDAAVEFRDYGDAPDSYGTLEASNGASHEIYLQLYLGNQFDNDIDGFVNGIDVNGNATDDDLIGADDDDGVVTFPQLNATDTSYSLNVNVTNTLANINDEESTLQGWIDFDRNGTFDSDEGSFQNIVPVGTTIQQLDWSVPADAQPGVTYVRIRVGRLDLNSRGGFTDLNATGRGGLGEVEDYQISIGESPSISITKTLAGPVTNNNDGTYSFSFSITAENTGNVPLSSIEINDDLAASFTNAASWSVSNIQSAQFSLNASFNGQGNNNLLDGSNALAVGANGTVSFDMTVTPGQVLAYVNSADVSGRSPANAQVIDIDSANVVFGEAPAIELTKSIDQITNNNDGTFDVEFVLTAQNQGDVPLSNVQITDNLVTTFQNAISWNVISTSSSVWSVNGAYDGSGIITLLQGANSLAFGASGSVNILVRVTPGTTLNYTNTALAFGDSPAAVRVNDQAIVDINFVENPAIAVVKSINGPVINNNDGTYNFDYLITVTNTGQVPINSLQLSDNLNTVFAQATSWSVLNVQSSDLTVNGAFDGSGEINLLQGTDLLAFNNSGSLTLSLQVEPGSTTVYTNRVDATGASPAAAQLSAFDTEDVSFGENPAIDVSKALVGQPVNNRDGSYTAIFSITVSNTGDVPLNALQLNDDLGSVFANADGFTVESVTSQSLTINNAYDGDVNTSLLTGTDQLPVSGSSELQLSVTIDAGSTFNYVNTTLASGQSPAGANVNDSAAAQLVLGENPAISVTKTAQIPVNNNDGTHTVVFDMNVENTGDVNLTNMSLTDDLALALSQAQSWSLVSVESSDFNVNGAYDGDSDSNLLTSEALQYAQSGSIRITVLITPGNQLDYQNITTVDAQSPATSNVSDSAIAQFSLQGAPPPQVEPAMVPTLSEYGMIVFALLVMAFGFFFRERLS